MGGNGWFGTTRLIFGAIVDIGERYSGTLFTCKCHFIFIIFVMGNVRSISPFQHPKSAFTGEVVVTFLGYSATNKHQR